MIYYRLLRDNKETGPYSEEEMILKGFKPYDLLWMEGKSAGWRYPSEIPAFKDFAPIVEEQPYDRFYKRVLPQTSVPAETAGNYTSFSTSAVNNSASVQRPSAMPGHVYDIHSLPAKHIHVILPSGNTVNLTTLVEKPVNKEPVQVVVPQEKYTIPETFIAPVEEIQQRLYAESKYVAEETAVKENQTLQIDVAGQLNGKWGKFPALINSFLSKQPIAGFSWTLILGAATGVITLLGLGVMIGLSINRDKNDAVLNELLNNKTKQQTSMPVSAGITENNTLQPVSAPGDEPKRSARSSSPKKELVQNAVAKSTVLPVDGNGTEKRIVADEKLPAVSIVQQKAEPIVVRAKPVAENIEKSLTLQPNDFKKSAFGGISNLKYTLYNGSATAIESVEVEVDYIQANDKVFKTERLLFKDIPAGTQSMLNAPSSNRGVKIRSRIVKINSKGISSPTAKS